jgi:CubicO group peptidase (beta-lactamase class C family)
MTNSIGDLLSYHIAARHYPGGIVHVEQERRVRAHQCAGQLHAEGDVAMHDDALFRIASLTKPVVTVAALAVVDERRCKLDAPIGEYLPALAKLGLKTGSAPTRQPTVRDLMCHTSGFAYANEVTDPAVRQKLQESHALTHLPHVSSHAFVGALSKLPLCAEPGTQFRYGSSTDVLGLILEAIEGKTLGAILRERVFDPLEMTQTSFQVREASHAHLASAHAEDRAWQHLVTPFGIAITGQPWMESGGAGLVSTLGDYAAFARMLSMSGEARSSRLLSTESFSLMSHDQLPEGVDGPLAYTGAGFGFALGLAVRSGWGSSAMPCRPGELTWSGISGTAMFVLPAERWFALAFTCNTASRMMARLELRRALARL